MKNQQLIARLIKKLREVDQVSVADFLASDRKKLLFGAGNQAMCTCSQLRKFHIYVDGLICSSSNDTCGHKHLPLDIPLFGITEFPHKKNDYDIILAINPKYNFEVIPTLREAGFQNIYYSDDWNKTNYLMRKLHFDNMIVTIGATVDSDIINFSNFKIRYSITSHEKNQATLTSIYQTALFHDFDELVLPGIFGLSAEFLHEGEYENNIVCVEENDVVLDLGANYGIFSCAAAAKAVNGKVYAFEPSPYETNLILSQNADLYNNIEIVLYAAADFSGSIDFWLNDEMAGSSSMIKKEYTSLAKIEVKAITIDEFVKEHKLSRVDFIKADIEGAERLMLKGAKETLKTYAPKLSLCTYHLPDDPEVMKKLILEANPNYVIVQKTHKLYAYVPK